jgi:phospholipase C
MHAPHDVRPGDRLVADVYEALRQNEQLWAKTMFILTFDEHGGFYDHVIPPAVDNPDGVVGQKSSRAPAFGFDRLGLRVPAMIASPWVAKGQIAHDEFRHTSIIATVREVFGLGGPLTRRDDSAQTLSGLLTNSPRSRLGIHQGTKGRILVRRLAISAPTVGWPVGFDFRHPVHRRLD